MKISQTLSFFWIIFQFCKAENKWGVQRDFYASVQDLWKKK